MKPCRSEIPLLQVRGLEVGYQPRRWRAVERVVAVQRVNLTIDRGEIVGLAGESGSGKSSLGWAMLQLLRPTGGEVFFEGQELTALWQRRWGTWRWRPPLRQLRRRLQIVLQHPGASFDPRLRGRDLLEEPRHIFPDASALLPEQALAEVGLTTSVLSRYPHTLSGGQQRRLALARALMLQPDFIVADEPLSHLDPGVGAHVLHLLHGLKERHGVTLLVISHNLAALRALCDRIAVMYRGELVEIGPSQAICDRPAHPYTRALRTAVPRINAPTAPAAPQPPVRPATAAGCPYYARCPDAFERCAVERPTLEPIAGAVSVACFRATRKSGPGVPDQA